MAQATDAEAAEPQRVASSYTTDHSVKMIPTQWAELGSIQAITLLCIASEYVELETTTINNSVTEEDCDNWDD